MDCFSCALHRPAFAHLRRRCDLQVWLIGIAIHEFSRWLYAVMFILFLIALFVELVRQAPQRKKLREEFSVSSIS